MVDGAEATGRFEEIFDYVIVGSGAAGATAAMILAEAGASVAVLEEGPRVETREFGEALWPAMRRLFRDQGAQVARGPAFIPVVQGSCLGGSTTINSAIMWRLPEDVWRPWKDDFGLGEALPFGELCGNFEQIEQDLGVRPVAESRWGNVARHLHEGSRRLGVAASPIRRGETGCRGSARCLTGCPYGAKQSMLVSYLPRAERRGAALITSARAARALWRGERVVAVEGTLAGAESRRQSLTAHAREAVIVAASAIQTPLFLARSGVGSPHLGRHFQAHPGGPLVGFFDRPVNMWSGATQGYEADHWRRELRMKIETISLPPEMLFARAPGAGSRWLANLAESGHYAIWAPQLRAYAQGTVSPGWFGADIRYALERRDLELFRRSLRKIAELFFAAGAREVRPGVYGMPEAIRPGEERLFDDAPLDARAYSMIVSHLFGTARMSLSASTGVVGPGFAVHGAANLYVIDSSVFPTNLGVNPQETIMGVAMLAAKAILAKHRAPR